MINLKWKGGLKINMNMKKIYVLIIVSNYSAQSMCAKKSIQSIRQISSKSIVSCLIEKKKKELKNFEKSLSHENIKQYEKWYPFYEAKYAVLKIPTYKVAGSLSYTMTLPEIEQKVKAVFSEMYRSGKIITRSDFKKYDQKKWIAKKDNLTRIWGAQYLAELFAKNNKSNFKVPDYIIVIDDPRKVRVKISFWSAFPAITRIKGEIYAQYINGSPAYPEVGFGFTDYSGPNILQSKDKNFYVIDTEYRSFYRAAPEEELFKNMPGPADVLGEFLKNRFLLIHDLTTTEAMLEFALASSKV